MTIYKRFLGREEYTTLFEQDYLPYPEKWSQKKGVS